MSSDHSVSSGNTPVAVSQSVSGSTESLGVRDVSVHETSGVQLTQYEDAAEHVQVDMPGVTPDQLWLATNPLPSQDLKTVLGRSYQLSTVAWSGQAMSADLAGYSNLDVLTNLLAIPQIAEKVEYYKFFRCRGVRVTVRINATPWHYGCIALSSTVNNSFMFHNSALADSFQYLNNRTVLMDATKAVAVDYDIPWSSNRQWYDVKSAAPNHLMTFRATVVVPLSMIGTVLVPAQITFFAQFLEPEVSFPVADSLVPMVEAHSSRSHTNAEARKKTTDDTMAGTISSMMDTTMTVVNDFASLAAKAAPLLALLDKPTALKPVQHIVNLPGTSMPHTEGLDTVVKMGASPESSAGFSNSSMADIVGNPTIEQMVQTPGFMDHTSWTTSTASGTRVALYEIGPQMKQAQSVNTYTPSFSWWYSNLFRFWRGGVKFYFHFVTSSFITARIRIVWFPYGVTPPATLTLNETGDYISRVYEVTGTMDVMFTVPYISPTLYKNMSVASQMIDNRLADTNGDSANSNGHLGLYLVNSMVSVDSAILPTITALMWSSMAEDVQFSNLAGVLAHNATTSALQFSPTYVPEVEALTSILDVFSASFDPIMECKTSVEFGLATSEQYHDLISFGKRYSVQPLRPRVASVTDHTTVWNSWALQVNDVSVEGHLGWITACHVNFRGSMRYKVFWFEAFEIGTGIPRVVGAHVDATSLEVFNVQPQWVTSNTGSNNFIEFEIPWNTNVPFEYRLPLSNARGVNAFYDIPATDANVNQVIGTLATAFGDDFAMGVCQAPPLIVLTPAPLLTKKR